MKLSRRLLITDSSNKIVGIIGKNLKVESSNKEIKTMFKAVLNNGINVPYVNEKEGERGLKSKPIEKEWELLSQMEKLLPLFGYSVKEE